jgi:hypothetical protein
MTVTELRGLALLDAVIAQIEAHPETWRQGSYRCETGMCVAGWAAEMTGGQWLYADTEGSADLLAAVPEDDPERVEEDAIDAHYRAQRLFGIGAFEAGHLFAGGNKLTDIRRIRDELAAGGLA